MNEVEFKEKNVLVQYKCQYKVDVGCFLIDSEGEFHHIYSSGGSELLIDKNYNAVDFLNNDNKNIIAIIHLDNETEIAEWSKNNNATLVNRVVIKVNEILENHIMFWVCSVCSEKVDEPEICNEIGYENAKYLVCSECIEKNTCCECFEYIQNEKLVNGCCSYCYERVIKDYFDDNYDYVSYIEYDNLDNKFVKVEDYDLDISNMIFEGMYAVKAVLKDKIHTYFVDASSEQEALDSVEIFVGRENLFEIIEIENVLDLIFKYS